MSTLPWEGTPEEIAGRSSAHICSEPGAVQLGSRLQSCAGSLQQGRDLQMFACKELCECAAGLSWLCWKEICAGCT